MLAIVANSMIICEPTLLCLCVWCRERERAWMNSWLVKSVFYVTLIARNYFEAKRWRIYLATFPGIIFGTSYVVLIRGIIEWTILMCRLSWSFWLALLFAFGLLWEFQDSFCPFYPTWRAIGILLKSFDSNHNFPLGIFPCLLSLSRHTETIERERVIFMSTKGQSWLMRQFRICE